MENGKILAKIISDAEARALETVAAAERSAEERSARTVELCQSRRDERLAELSARCDENLKRREITARLDCNKLLLSARREVLDSVFEVALKRLCELPEGEYLSFVQKLIEEHAQPNDGLVLSSSCAYTQKIAELPVVKDRALTVKTDGAFLGGVVIVGEKCDKNLSFEALIQSAKEEKQAEIAARLF